MGATQGATHTIVREAVELLLRLGLDSYTPEILAREVDRPTVSPYAGCQVRLARVQHTVVGPQEWPCIRHVAAIYNCGPDEIMAYGKVTYDECRLRMIELEICVNGRLAISRTVRVKPDGMLVPDGMPDGFDPYA